MTAACEDCITGVHGPNAHRKNLPPHVPAPTDHRHRLTEAIKRAPFHELRADDHTNGPLIITAYVDDLARAVLAVRDHEMERLRSQITDLQRNNAVLGRDGTRATERRMQLAATLSEVLQHFVHKGHPGEPCLQTGWISEKTVARWRSIACQPAPAQTAEETR